MFPKRIYLFVGCSTLALCCAEAAYTADESEPPPNIVLILADDLGSHQLGCYGSDFYETPNLDRLAAQGIRFTRAYSAAAVCSPTRASIMTGKHPARLHLTDYIPGNRYPYARLRTPEWQPSLPLAETTLAEALAEVGYVSGHFGKWHLNVDKDYADGRPGDPRSQGFSDVLTTLKPSGREAEDATADPDYDAHHVNEITDRAIGFIETNQDRPFFCYVPYNSIHDPKMAYAPTVEKYALKPNASPEAGKDTLLAAMLDDLDASAGRIMDALDRLELAKNTILIFYSDNGALGGAEARKPLYGDKADLYEGGIHVPLIVRWPGRIDPGASSNALVSSTDFFPTLLEAAGVAQAGSVDGQSFLPALRGETIFEDRSLYWHFPHYHSGGVAPSGAIRRGNYKLIEWFEQTAVDPDDPDGYSLYNLENDPGERKNLVETEPELANSLREELAAWRRDVGAQMMTLNPEYDPEKANQRD